MLINYHTFKLLLIIVNFTCIFQVSPKRTEGFLRDFRTKRGYRGTERYVGVVND